MYWRTETKRRKKSGKPDEDQSEYERVFEKFFRSVGPPNVKTVKTSILIEPSLKV
jgi:hypothetical protein